MSELAHVRGPDQPAVLDLTIGDALRAAAADAPDRLALVTGGPDSARRRAWTYAELLRDAERTARALAGRFEPGERVAIWSQNTPEWELLEFGCAMAGVILVTVNPAYRPDELAYVLNQSRSAGLFVSPGFRGNDMPAAVEQVRPECPHLREIVRLDDWDRFIAGGDTGRALPPVAPGDACMIQYTSGTTGFPKGALLHHRGLVTNGAHTLDRMGVEEGAVWVTTMPLFHTGGCVLCVLGAVSKRATQVLLEAFDPGLMLKLTAEYRACAFMAVPTMLIALLEHPDFPDTDLSSVKAVTSGGSTVPAHVVRRFEEELGATFTIVFGQTETSPVSQMVHPTDSIADKAATLGAPMPNVEVKIVDPETGATMKFGERGEYCTRGYLVMLGYWDNPEATAKTIDPDGWLHTGDLASMDPRGYCSIEGRLKDMIIRGGENIYPRELEELLFRHPTVGEVAIVGLPDDRLGEVVGAFVRAAPGSTPDRSALFTFCREHLSPQKTPKHWFLVDRFPLTGSGKIQKFVLREQWTRGELEEMT